MTTHLPDAAAEIDRLLEAHARLVQAGDRDGAMRARQAAATLAATADAARSMVVAERLGDVLAPAAPRPEFRARLGGELDAAAAALANRSTARQGQARRLRVRTLVQGGAAVAVVGLMAAAVLWRGRTTERLPA